MALVLADRVKESTTTTGTGTVTLLGAATGFQSFAVIGNGNTTYYTIAGQTTSEWEVGIGTYTLAGTLLARTTVLSNSAGTQPSALSFSAGTKDVFVTYPSSKSVNLDASGNATALGTPASGVVTNLTGTASININGTVGATTATTGAFTTLSATGVTTVQAGTAALPAITTTGDTNTGIFFPAADTIAFTEGGVESMRIDSTGNVLVTGYGRFGGSLAFIGKSSDLVSGGSATDAAFRYDGNNLVFAYSNTERMRIDSSGNVGIGTTGPTSKLHVSGGRTDLVAASETYALGVRYGVGTGIYYIGASNSATPDLIFSQTGGSERMRLTNAGDLGIGTSSPASIGGTLSVVTNGNTGTGYFRNLATSGITSDQLQVGVSQSTSLTSFYFSRFYQNVISSPTPMHHIRGDGEGYFAGSVGIGTSTPSTKLTVVSATNAGIAVNDGTVNTIIYNSTGGVASIGTTTNHPVDFYTNNAARMRIDTSGNVGIGTSSPNGKLAVIPSANPTTVAASTTLTLGEATNNSAYQLRMAYSSLSSVFTGVIDAIQNSTGAPLALNPTGGRVGIGTVSPSQKFVVSNAGADNIVMCENSTDSIQMFMQATGASSGVVGTLTNHFVGFLTNNTERMRIDTSGNLLVGTTSTTSNARFAVTTSSTSNLDYGIYAKNSGGAFLLGIDNNGGFSTGTAAGSPYNATTASAANVFVDSNGALNRSTSSLKYKTGVQDATHGLAEVMSLRPVTYKGKNDGDTIFGGLIAEEVHAAGLTEFVQYAEDGSPDALAYGNMVSLCIKAIQEQQATIVSLQDTLTALTTRITALEST